MITSACSTFKPRHLLAVLVMVLTPFPAAIAAVTATTKGVHPDELRKRAAKGDVPAMWVLQSGAVWYKNPKKKKEPEKRITFTQEERLKWIRAGVAAGDPYSQQKLARILGKGASVPGGYAEDNFSALVPIDYAESARLARAAAAGFRQHKEEFKYGGIDGGEKLLERAAGQEEFARQSEDLLVLLPLAEAGDKEAIWGVYLVHSVAHNYPDIWTWLNRAVKAGDPRAVIETWRRTSWQTSYKAWDQGKPNAWLMMAARLGDPSAMEHLANTYAWYAKDDAKALEWYQKAHAAGAHFSEVGAHLYGDPRALSLFKAAEAGSGAAAYNLAQYYLHGEWHGRNTAQYERWMQEAVKLHHPEAKFEWGMRTDNSGLIAQAAAAGHRAAKVETEARRVRAAIENRRIADERAAAQRTQAERVFNTLRTGTTYTKNGLDEQTLFAALQAAQTDAERKLIADENARRVAEYNATSQATSSYRPMQVTPYVSKPTYKTQEDYRREHREYKEQLVERIRSVTRRP